MGERIPTDPGLETELVVRVTSRSEESGPVPDAMLLVAVSGDRTTGRARYLSWIVGYGDLDQASEAEPGRWTLVEPPSPYSGRVVWEPFGWGPLEQVWTNPTLSERLARDPFRNGSRRILATELGPVAGPSVHG